MDDELIDRLIQALNDQPLAADLLIAALSDRIWASQRSSNLQDASHESQVRWLNQGVAITADSTGVGRDLIGEGYFDTVNLIGGKGYANANNPRQVDITASAGADCLFDYLVSSCFAALSGFTEGNTYSSLSGCTFKGYSTIQGALTAAGALSASDSSTIAICSGTYAEKLTRTDVAGASLILLGTGQANTIIKPGTGSGTIITLPAQSLGGNVVDISGLTIDTTGMNAGAVGLSLGSAARVKLSRVHISLGNATDVGINPGGSAVNGLQMSQVNFSGSGIGIQTDSGSVTNISGSNVSFETGLAVGMHMRGQSNGNVSAWFGCAIGLKYSGGASVQGMSLYGSAFYGCTTGIQHVGGNVANNNGFIWDGSYFEACTTDIDLSGLTGNLSGVTIGPSSHIAGTNGIKLHATRFIHSVVVGQTFSGYVAGNEISGMTQAQMITADTQVCHNATDSGTLITEYGVGHTGSGTGGAAPNNAQYLTLATDATLTSERVWTPGNGLINGATDAGAGSTYTVALKDLNANWTQAGVFDISTAGNLTVLKHLAAGTTSAIDAAIILQFSETFTNPAGDSTAIGGSVVKAITSANAQNVFGIDMNAVQVSGAFADTGIIRGFRAVTQRLTSTGTSADFRSFEAASAHNGGTTTTDRYGFYAANATGTGAVTNQYGFYVPAFTKGGTNWAFYSVSANSFFGGDVWIGSDKQLKLYDIDNSNFIGIRADSARTTDLTYVLPATDPTAGQVLSSTAPVASVATTSWTSINTAHELLWFSQTPTSGDNLAYTPIRFNGLGATAISPMSVTAKDYGYGTTRINLLRAPNAHTVSATGGLPNPVFTTILNTDLNIESSHMTFTGMEDVTITGGAVSGTALAYDDEIRCDYDAVNNAVNMTALLSVTV